MSIRGVNLLVAAQVKTTDSLPLLGECLTAYVQDIYGEQTKKDVQDDIAEVCCLREVVRAFGIESGNHSTGENGIGGEGFGSLGDLQDKVDTCLKYFKYVTLLESRFPLGISSKSLGSMDTNFGDPTSDVKKSGKTFGVDRLKKISFCWYDSYRGNKKCSQQSFLFEKCSVLFNAGALCMQLALVERSRNSNTNSTGNNVGNGLKVACKSFQTAAGYFQYLKESLVPRLISGQGAYSNGSGVLSSLSNINNNFVITPDLSRESCSMLELLCLAQAQECFYELALGSGKNNTIISKIARHCGSLYADAYAMAQQSPLVNHVDKNWALYLMSKGKLFDALSYKHLALENRAEEKIGEEIARLNAASIAIQTCLQYRKILNGSLVGVLGDLDNEVQRDLKRAHKENDTIYLSRIPDIESLPQLLSVSMVKAETENIAKSLSANNMKLFSKLVPDVSAKALSRYTEMVDVLVRAELAKLESESDNARLKLIQYDLPNVLFAIDDGNSNNVNVNNDSSLPSPLAGQLEIIESEGGVAQMWSLMEQIEGLSNINRDMIASVTRTLDEEEVSDQSMRDQFTSRWVAVPSNTLNKALRDKSNDYEKGCAQASLSDQTLKKKFVEYEPQFQGLSVASMIFRVPKLQNHLVTTSCAEKLRNVIVKLQSLGASREKIETGIQNVKSNDNILPLIMATTQSYDALFTEELKKYTPVQEQIASVVEDQRKLISEMDILFTEFQQSYDIASWREACDAFVEDGKDLINIFNQLKENMNEGLRFHTAQQDAIAALQQQCEDFCATRKIQRQELVDKIQTQALQSYASQQSQLSENFSRMNTGEPFPHKTQYVPSEAPKSTLESMETQHQPQLSPFQTAPGSRSQIVQPQPLSPSSSQLPQQQMQNLQESHQYYQPTIGVPPPPPPPLQPPPQQYYPHQPSYHHYPQDGQVLAPSLASPHYQQNLQSQAAVPSAYYEQHPTHPQAQFHHTISREYQNQHANNQQQHYSTHQHVVQQQTNTPVYQSFQDSQFQHQIQPAPGPYTQQYAAPQQQQHPKMYQ